MHHLLSTPEATEVNERERREAGAQPAERMALIGTMARKVAHEIRTPLGSITLNLDLMNLEISRLAEAAGDANEEGRALIKEMRTEAGRIQSILEDYLQIARLATPRRERVNLNDFLEQKLPQLRGELELEKVELHAEIDPSAGFINADPAQLWQIVLKLVRNSREAIDGGGKIVIKTLREADEVLLVVNDNGSGMTEEQLHHLYEPFFTTKHRATGLGLALVQQIVTTHGGSIACESAPGAGTTFTISLPATERATPPEPSAAGITSALNISNHA